MRKGTVLETGEKWAVVLLDTGEYKRVRNTSLLEVGQIYESISPTYTRLAIAAVLVLMIMAGTIDYFSVKAYAQVASQVEIGVNRYGRVVHVAAIGGDGDEIVKTVDIKNARAEDAAELITGHAIELAGKRGLINDPKLFKVNIEGKANKKFETELLRKMDSGVQKVVKNLPKQQGNSLKKPGLIKKNNEGNRGGVPEESLGAMKTSTEKNHVIQGKQRITKPENRSNIPDISNKKSNSASAGKNDNSNEQILSTQTKSKAQDNSQKVQPVYIECDQTPGQKNVDPKNNPVNHSQIKSPESGGNEKKQESTRGIDQGQNERKPEKTDGKSMDVGRAK